MSLPVILRPEADADVTAAHAWYEARRAGLGQDFLDRLDAALTQIGAMPELCGLVWQDVRAYRLKRFPYVVYYRVLTDRVEVLAVLHGSRDASVWQSRA